MITALISELRPAITANSTPDLLQDITLGVIAPKKPTTDILVSEFYPC